MTPHANVRVASQRPPLMMAHSSSGYFANERRISWLELDISLFSACSKCDKAESKKEFSLRKTPLSCLVSIFLRHTLSQASSNFDYLIHTFRHTLGYLTLKSSRNLKKIFKKCNALKTKHFVDKLRKTVWIFKNRQTKTK